jgi:type II secretory pathway pseudopilin PulG
MRVAGSRRGGFVPAYLLVPVVVALIVITVAAGWVLGRRQAARERVEFGALLRALVVAQDTFHAAHGRYATSLEQLPGIAVARARLEITAASDSSWAARVRGQRIACGVFAGSPASAPNAAVTVPREPACW